MNGDPLGDAAAGLVEGLAAGGVRAAVVCPGSRSTPFALALDRHPAIRVWMHVDERSAAYFALGLARGQGRPVVVLTTSGTAVGNLLPAVMEARYGGGALVVLSADRPPELRQVGAPQTVDQVKLFGPTVKASWDLPVPDRAVPTSHWVMAGVRAAAAAHGAPAGPVHVNVPVREPLVPHWPPDEGPRPPVAVARAAHVTDWDALDAFGAGEPRGVIVAGADSLLGARRTVARLADRWGWAVWADPLSNLRGRIPTVATADWLARSLPEGHWPAKILRVGPAPTSKAANRLMAQVPTAVVDAAGSWRDPGGSAVAWFPTDLETWDDEPWPWPPGASCDTPWRQGWKHLDAQAAGWLARRLADAPVGLSSHWAHDLASVVPAAALVMVGNSLPVRDLDQWFAGSDRFTLFGNRGVSGIDGVASTGLGLAAARDQRLLLVVGDLSFVHDLNGWLPVRLEGLGATVLVVNNDGGGIFNTLPQGELPPESFERLFGTPHELNFAGAATLYGGRYDKTSSWAETAAVLSAGQRGDGLEIVDWHTTPRAAYAAWLAETQALLAHDLSDAWHALV